jgi:hypothetical protein
MCAIVCSFPPEPRDGCANSIALPSRSSPRASSRLLMYAEAVLRLCASMVVVGSLLCRFRCRPMLVSTQPLLAPKGPCTSRS